jgi:hypothetical protein
VGAGSGLAVGTGSDVALGEGQTGLGQGLSVGFGKLEGGAAVSEGTGSGVVAEGIDTTCVRASSLAERVSGSGEGVTAGWQPLASLSSCRAVMTSGGSGSPSGTQGSKNHVTPFEIPHARLTHGDLDRRWWRGGERGHKAREQCHRYGGGRP